MFNPFYPFTNQLLNAFVERGKRYFVRQTFERGRNIGDEDIRECFLISHYHNLTTALDHFGAIAYDQRRFLYDWNKEHHRKKLLLAASGVPGYKIFAAVLKPNWDKPVEKQYNSHIRRYLQEIGWQPRRDEGVLTNYELQFGELYIRIKSGKREVKIKFEEIENFT